MFNKKNLILLVPILIFFFINFNVVTVEADNVQPEVEIFSINGYNNFSKKAFTMQPTPVSVTNILNFVENSTKRQPKELMKYVYPTFSDMQLNSITANLEQSNSFLKNQGYKTKIVSGPLDDNIIKEEIKNNRPVIAYLKANGNYWIEQETSVVILGYQKIAFPGQLPMVIYMYDSVIHGSGAIFSGGENEIALLLNENNTDPTANVTFKWVSSLYGFQK